MCGRFVLKATPEEIADYLDLIGLEDFPPRFNIAPTQPILIIVEGERQELGSNLPNRQAMLVRWGFMPGWVKDPKTFPLLINARSETAIGKASFRAAMRHRRILIPASGFYEWKRPSKEEGGKPQAYYIRPKRGGIVAFAGLMETWSSADGSEVDTGAILTTAANAAMSRVHDRMPVVIAPEDFSRWLDCKTQEPREVSSLMRAADEDFFEMIPVSDRVNKVANVGPDLIVPVEEAAPLAPVEGEERATVVVLDNGYASCELRLDVENENGARKRHLQSRQAPHCLLNMKEIRQSLPAWVCAPPSWRQLPQPSGQAADNAPSNPALPASRFSSFQSFHPPQIACQAYDSSAFLTSSLGVNRDEFEADSIN